LTISWAQRLAHPEKKIRDSTIRKLRSWLIGKEKITDLDLLRIWKGIFYFFWMSDKVPIQQQVAGQISDLLLPPVRIERALMFFRAGLTTLKREWTSVDQLRMDKFMSLARKFFHRSLLALQRSGWTKQQVEGWVDVLVEPSLDQPAALSPETNVRGLALHLIDVFLTELERTCAAADESNNSTPTATATAAASSSAMSIETFTTILTPFFHLLAACSDHSLVRRVCKEVFDPLVDICHAAAEQAAKERIAEKKKQQAQAKSQSNKKKGKKGKKKQEDEEMDDVEEETFELEGTAADFPSLYLILRGHADKISSILYQFAAEPSILSRNRKLLYSYRARLDDAHRKQVEPDEDEEDDQPNPAPLPFGPAAAATASKSKKRKADTQPEEGDESTADAATIDGVAPQKKKKNKKQRLAEKRRKTEALLGTDRLPSTKAEAQQQQQQQQNGTEPKKSKKQRQQTTEEDENDEHDEVEMNHDAADVDADMTNGDIIADESEYDETAHAMVDGFFASEREAEEDDDPAVSAPQPTLTPKEQRKLDAALKKKAKAQSKTLTPKKRVTPQVVTEQEEDGTIQMEMEQSVSDEQLEQQQPVSEPISNGKNKKQKHKSRKTSKPSDAAAASATLPDPPSTAAAAPAAPSTPTLASTPSKKTKKRQSQGSPSTPESVATTTTTATTTAVAPSTPEATSTPRPADSQPPAPTPTPKMPRSALKKSSSTPAATVLSSTSIAALTTPTHASNTVSRIPSSSAKKNVTIMLSRNQVKSFKRFSRDSITVETSQLLAKPSPRSALKASSLEMYYTKNKNGREISARQKLLSQDLNMAAPDVSNGHGASNTTLGKTNTPPTSPRAKAADFF